MNVIEASGICIPAGFIVGLLTGRYLLKEPAQTTRIVPVARKVDNRIVGGYSRAERRAHKRRAR